MIRVTVTYPAGEGSTFDHDYYRDTHVPLAMSAWGLDASAVEIDKGVNGPSVAAVQFKFADMAAFGAAMAAPGTGDVMADVANYTNITPVMQVSEIVG